MNSATDDPLQSATTIFHSLVAGRLTDKYKAVELLSDRAESIDLATLRTLLIKSINEDWYAGKEEEEEDQSIGKTRSWLLDALGRISAGDDDATRVVAEHVSALEPYVWARYWSLEGLISGKNAKAVDVAKTVVDDNDNPLVAILATAFLASRNDKEALRMIRECLNDPDRLWFALRGLRIAPVPATVSTICKIVEEAGYADETYDAIMALGAIPSNWSHSESAAQALSTCIVKLRGTPWKDGMRTSAITGLGNLKLETYGPLLLEELVDDNPAVVREAVQSMERILGLNVCVVRIVEAASKRGAASTDAYGRALRWLNCEAVAEELETLMVTGSAKHQDVARALLAETRGRSRIEKLRARTDVMKQYSEVLEKSEEKIRELFEVSVREAQSGFHLAIIMDVVVFAVGIMLLVGSAVFALFATGDLATWAGIGLSGGVGVLGVVYGVLIANPRRQVRNLVDHLMRVKMVFLSYLRRLHQADQAYARRLLDEEPITLEEVEGFAGAVGEIMQTTIDQNLYSSDNSHRPAHDQTAATGCGASAASSRTPATVD